MTKDEFITLIKIAEAIMKIDQACRSLTNFGLDEGQCNDVFLLWTLLQDNSAPKYRMEGNTELEMQSYRAFSQILESTTLTPEEKYSLLTSDERPDSGQPNQALITYLQEWRKNGNKLILWTCRAGEALSKAVEWCREQNLEFDAVNDNLPEIIEYYGHNSRKISCDYYIDDRMLLPENAKA